jgi:hypothetical protein
MSRYCGFRRSRSLGRGLAAGAVLLIASMLSGGAAHAQGRLDAQYEASLAGILVGKGSWAIEIADDQYSASADGGTSGIFKAFSGGHGSTVAQGRIVNGQFAPANYTATVAYDSKQTEIIRILLAAGNVKESSIEPVPDPNPDRLPVTEAHRKGVIDPMTGALVRVAGTGDLMGPDACLSQASVFDGRMRYDLKLTFKRIETVKAKGYQGPTVVCGLSFTPISGYVPDRAAIKYLTALRTMEVWLAPIAGTRVLVPFKVLVPTPIGMAALEATHFVSTATVRTTAKTQ